MQLGRAQASLGLALGMGVLLLVAWLRDAPRGEPASDPSCTCALERTRSGWCEACRLGHVAGRTIRSLVLYEALDPHGHDVDGAGMPCASCRVAVREDGFCALHGRGFVGGRAYLSRLSYHVARGEDEAVATELALLDEALRAAERCELCAAAMVLDGTCPRCRLSYAAGRPRPMR